MQMNKVRSWKVKYVPLKENAFQSKKDQIQSPPLEMLYYTLSPSPSGFSPNDQCLCLAFFLILGFGLFPTQGTSESSGKVATDGKDTCLPKVLRETPYEAWGEREGQRQAMQGSGQENVCQKWEEAGAGWQERGMGGATGDVAVYSKMLLELPLGVKMMLAIRPWGKNGIFSFVWFCVVLMQFPRKIKSS